MAADQSLINASLQEALSKVGPDKTEFYESQAKTPVLAATNIASMFQKQNEEKQKAWDAIAEPVETMMRKLASGSDQLGGMHPANVARLKKLQKEFNAAYGNKEKEDEIKFKIEQVASEINVIAAGFGKFGQSYLDGTLNIKESNPEFYESFGKIWDVDGKYDDVEFSWGDNNKLSVTTNGKTQKVTDLFNGLVPDNSAPSINLGNLGSKATKWTKWDSKAFKRGALESMKTKDDYANLIGKDTFGDVSFKEALATLFDQDEKNDNPDIAGIMKNLGVVINENNKATLYDAITNVHSNNFNLEQAKNIAAQWYTDGYGASKFKEGEQARRNKNGGDLGGYLPGMRDYQQDWQVRKYINDLEKGNKIIFKDSNGDQVEAIPTGDGNYNYRNQIISKDELGSKIGLPGYSFSGASTTTNSGGSKDLSPFFGPNANEENAVDKLRAMYPNLKISSPVGMREKIKVNEKIFYLRGKGESTAEMQMKLLQEHITKINRGETSVSQTNPYG